MEKLIEKYKSKITQLQSKRNSFELKGMSGACVAITGEIQAYNAVLADLKRALETKQPTESANCAIFDVSDTVCPACYGAGVVPGDINGCYHCAGTGKQTGR